MPKRKVLALMEHGRGINTWKARYAAGKVSEKVPYGYDVDDPEWDLVFSFDSRESRIVSIVRRGLLRILGFDLVHVWRNRKLAATADVVWTHTEHVHVAYTLLSSLSRHLPPALCQSVWLPEELTHLPWLKRRLATWALRRSSVNVSNSVANVPHLEAIAPSRPLRYVAFGISPEPFASINHAGDSPPQGSPFRILALGNDRHRDWATLIEAARNLTEVQFRVLTRHALPTDPSNNVEFAAAGSFDEVLAAYEWANLVCLPLTPNDHASGITVALEATYAKRPLLVTNVGGLGAYLPSLKPFSLEPGADAKAWEIAIRRTQANEDGVLAKMLKAAQHDASALDLTSRGYSRRLLDLTKDIV